MNVNYIWSEGLKTSFKKKQIYVVLTAKLKTLKWQHVF